VDLCKSASAKLSNTVVEEAIFSFYIFLQFLTSRFENGDNGMLGWAIRHKLFFATVSQTQICPILANFFVTFCQTFL
jgi:hypothetical protein